MRTLCLLLAAILALALAGCGSKREKQSRADKEVQELLSITMNENKPRLKAFAEKKGVAGLKELLKEDSARVRMVALTCLGLLKGNAEATATLVAAADGADSEDAYWAVVGLAAQGAPEAKEVIEKMIRSEDPRRRQGACVAIYEYGDSSLYPLLEATCDDPEPSVQAVARQLRNMLGKPRVVPKEGVGYAPGEAPAP